MNWWPKKQVVVPVDFSSESLKAVQTAAKMVDQPSHLHVVHVLVDLPVGEPGIVWGVIDKTSRIHHATLALEESLQELGVEDAQLHVLVGDPGREIAQCASELKADLIVLPSHGRTGIKRLLIGSVAERVLRLAHCPVLVLRE